MTITVIYSNPQWLQTPTGTTIGNLHGVVADAEHVWIQNACQDHRHSCLWRCNHDGKILETLRCAELPAPHGLEWYEHPAHGRCLLQTDNHSGMLLMRPDGKILW